MGPRNILPDAAVASRAGFAVAVYTDIYATAGQKKAPAGWVALKESGTTCQVVGTVWIVLMMRPATR